MCSSSNSNSMYASKVNAYYSPNISSDKFSCSQGGKSFIKVQLNICHPSPVSLLVDTGADISILKVDTLNDNASCNTSDTCKISGISSDEIETKASCVGKLILEQNIYLTHSFHIVESDFPIAYHGILGKDFLSTYGCVIDYSKNVLEIPNNSNIMGIPLESDVTVVPPRSEKIINCKSRLGPGEYLCKSKEIRKGVYLANSIVKCENNSVTFSVLNTTEDSFNINTIDSFVDENLNQYEVLKPNNYTNKIENRLQLLESTLL